MKTLFVILLGLAACASEDRSSEFTKEGDTGSEPRPTVDRSSLGEACGATKPCATGKKCFGFSQIDPAVTEHHCQVNPCDAVRNCACVVDDNALAARCN